VNINKAIQSAFEHYRAGNLQNAEILFKKILQKKPHHFDSLHCLGVIYSRIRNYDISIQYFKRALHINSNIPELHFHLGIAFQANGRHDEAIPCYQNALRLKPDSADACYNLGIAFQAKGRFDEAIPCYQNALRLKPDSADACYNLGIAFQAKGRLDEAIPCYQNALRLKPNFTDAYLSLGYTFREQGKQEKALAAYDMALHFKPDYLPAMWGRCMSHLLITYSDYPSIEVSRVRYFSELMRLKGVISGGTLTALDIARIAEKTVGRLQPFYLAYQGMNDRELQQVYGQMVCEIMAHRYPQFAHCPPKPAISSEGKIRVGIVSGFFYRHSNWKIPIKGWVENLDNKRFTLYGYYTRSGQDRETEVAGKSFSRFVEGIYSFEGLCKTIREDNLHVLIYPEIGMDQMTAQLAALRLAPIQCNSWGHPETSGFPTIDYFLSSDLMEPPDADDHYTEHLIRLPNLSIYYTPPDVLSADINRGTFGLRSESILYLCPQSLFKYLPQYDEVFPRIARLIGDCQFLFISFQKSSWVTEQFRSRINQAFHRFNLNADDYVVFLPRLEPEKYHAINRLADVSLDSIGWSGCNSTLEALACDLPVVTLPGNLMRGRHSSAILTMMGVTETIAASLDEYVSLAAKLGQDVEWRRYISEKISENKYQAYQDRTCITALENFLEQAVKERI
jgi:protein O-GlcNAc transferase